MGFAVFLKYRRSKYSHIPTPELPGRIKGFFLGHVVQMAEAQKKGKSFTATILPDWEKTYGSTFVIHFIHQPFVVTSDIAAVKALLIDNNLSKPWVQTKAWWTLFGTRFVGRSGLIATIDENHWKSVRGIMNPVFHRKVLLSFLDQFNTTADAVMNKLASKADGKTVINLQDMMNRVTLDIIGKVAFDMDIDSISEKENPFGNAIKLCFEAFDRQFTSQYEFKLFDDYPKRVRNACQLLRETGKKLILERQKSIADGTPPGDDILSYIAEAPKQDPSLEMEDLQDLFVVFFIAGQETTGNTLSFALQELGRNPEVMKKCQDVVDSVLGSRPEITFQDLTNLNYIGLVFKETLRKYPTVGGTIREVAEETDIGGYKIPAGTVVMPISWNIHRSAEFWPEPEEFRPERFSSENKHNPYTFWPFSLGNKNCIGQNFAKLEAKIILSKFIQKFNLELDPNQSFDVEQAATLKPKDGVLATLTMR